MRKLQSRINDFTSSNCSQQSPDLEIVLAEYFEPPCQLQSIHTIADMRMIETAIWSQIELERTPAQRGVRNISRYRIAIRSYPLGYRVCAATDTNVLRYTYTHFHTHSHRFLQQYLVVETGEPGILLIEAYSAVVLVQTIGQSFPAIEVTTISKPTCNGCNTRIPY